MSDSQRYRAFISYSHRDARVALRLHRALEGYRVPKRLRASAGEFGPVPERLHPIFCDREELASSADLGQRVRDALDASAALIVVCSPQAARSRWVNEEIAAFRRGGGARARRIHCVIAAGEPHAGDERECFPPALRGDAQVAEPIAADLRRGMDGARRARLKLIAGLLGIDFDTLRQRDAQRRHRRTLAVAVASLAGMLLASALALSAWIERNNARRQQALAEAATADAQRRQSQAEGLLGFLLDDLRPKLEKVGRLDLLETVDDKAEKYFASLSPADINDSTLARQAQTLTAIGQVRLSQARFREALDSFQNAYLRSSELADRHPRDGARLFDRGQAEYWVGNVYWKSRDLDQAQVWLTHYRDTSRAVYALDPSNVDWQHELAYGDHNLAVLEFERGRLDVAADAFERARRTLEALQARAGNDAQTAFDIADEISWEGNAQEQLGNLARATELLADKSERLRAISDADANTPRWKAEWSTAQVMQSELLRVRGRHAEALAAANAAVERLKALVALDPGNKEWSQDHLYALLARAAAEVGVADAAGAHGDLAAAQPLLDQFAPAESQDRHVRRDLLDSVSLRIQLALRGNDRAGARAAAQVLGKIERDDAVAPLSAEAAGREASSLVAAGLAQEHAADAEAYFAAARSRLQPLAAQSRYWRVLDPWLRLALLSGDTAEAHRVETLLSGIGYAPLFAWPAAPRKNSAGPGARASTAAPATPSIATRSDAVH